MTQKTTHIITSSLIGVTAYMCVDIIHEVIGHSSAALIADSTITLLTSVYFKSNPANLIIGLCGPLSNLLFGVLFFVILKYKSIRSSLVSLLVTTMMAYNLFWFSGTIVQSSFSKTGDWTYAVAQLNIGAFEKPLLLSMGLIAYVIAIKLVANRFSNLRFRLLELSIKQHLYYAYFFGVLAAVMAGLLFAPNRIAASKEGFLEMMASLPILFIKHSSSETVPQHSVRSPWLFCISVCVAYFLFCFTLGKGIY